MQFKGFVIGVIRNDKDVVIVRTGLYALDEWALLGIKNIDLVPLKEKAGFGNFLAGHDVTTIIFRVHAASPTAN